MKDVPQLPTKSYAVKLSLKIMSVIMASILIGLIGLLIWEITSLPLTLLEDFLNICYIGLCFLGTFMLFVYFNDCLEVSSEGVTYYGLGFRIYTPWENITGVARMRHPHVFLSIRSINVFMFRSPALIDVSINEGKRRGIAVIERHWLVFPKKPDRYALCLPLFISENMASGDLWQHELGGYIRQYAPHIENWQKNNNRPTVIKRY